MKVLFVAVGNPVPTFIERRINSLALGNLQLVVALAYNQKHNFDSNVQIVRYGRWKQITWRYAFKFLINLILYFHHAIRLYNYSDYSSITRKLDSVILLLPLAKLQNVDIIHVQWLGHTSVFAPLKKILKAPLLVSVRGSQITVYPMVREDFPDILKKAISTADYLHAVSKDIYNYCLHFGAGRDKVFVNYNGIDVQRFFPVWNTFSENKMKIISVGALIWRKGYWFQLLIVKKLIEQGKSCTLTIIGKGPDDIGLKYVSRSLGISEHVEFCGFLKENEVIHRLQSSDIYLFTSFAEGISNSLVEGAACGLPVVAFRCEGVEDIVEDGFNGYIVSPADVDGAVKSIISLYDVNLRSKMSINARKKVEHSFDQQFWVDDMVNHYKRIAGHA